MSAKSQLQRKLIFAKRGQYKTEKNTPKQWRWVWESGWENKGKLPIRIKRKKKVNECLSFSEFFQRIN